MPCLPRYYVICWVCWDNFPTSLRLLQNCFKISSRQFQNCFKDFLTKIQGCFKNVSMRFCFAILLLHGSHRSYPSRRRACLLKIYRISEVDLGLVKTVPRKGWVFFGLCVWLLVSLSIIPFWDALTNYTLYWLLPGFKKISPKTKITLIGKSSSVAQYSDEMW